MTTCAAESAHDTPATCQHPSNVSHFNRCFQRSKEPDAKKLFCPLKAIPELNAAMLVLGPSTSHND